MSIELHGYELGKVGHSYQTASIVHTPTHAQTRTEKRKTGQTDIHTRKLHISAAIEPCVVYYVAVEPCIVYYVYKHIKYTDTQLSTRHCSE